MNKLVLKTTFKYRYKYLESFLPRNTFFIVLPPRRLISSDYLSEN